MATHAGDATLTQRHERLARQMVLVLPNFGNWSRQMRDFDTPYGKAGIRQLEVLYFLRHGLLDTPHPTATDFARQFQTQRSVLTRILAKLEAGGFVTRQPNPDDRRASRIAITEQGILLSDYVQQQYFAEMQSTLTDLDQADTACLEHAMTLLVQVAQKLGTQRVGSFLTPEDRPDDESTNAGRP